MSEENFGIVNVQFADRYQPGEYSGRKYSYLTAIELAPGDVVAVPTKNGEGVAKVIDVCVPEGSVKEDVLPLLKTITRKHESEPSGRGDAQTPQAPEAPKTTQATHIPQVSIDDI